MKSKWVSLNEACEILNISLSTLRRRIDNGDMESKLEGNKRLVLIHHDASSDTLTKQEVTQTDAPFVEQLKYQIESLQKQLDTRESEAAKLQDELS